MTGGAQAGRAVQFGLLGPLQVHAGGQHVDIPSGRRRALLAVLVLNRDAVVPVEVLLEALWGDATPPSGTATLRTHVARLRSALPGTAANELAPVTLRWREIGYVLEMHNGQLDVYRFDSLLAEGKAALGRGAVELAVARLGAALELWRGPALAEFADRGFARAEANRLEEARRCAIEDLAEAELAAGRPAAALSRVEAQVVTHPLRERAWGLRLQALCSLGRRAEALAAFRDVRALLRDQLGVEPTSDLRDLHTRILRQDAAPAARAPAVRAARSRPAPAGVGARSPFVGREQERAALAAALTRTVEGTGGLILLAGEPGIGKTRLAEEAADDAAAREVDAFAGHCYEQAGAPPYVAVIEILEAALGSAPSPTVFLTEVLGDAAPEVARLVPQLRRLFPDLPQPMELPPEQERRYLFTCLTEVLARLTAHRPVLLLLDDVQWADEPTLAFVEHLAPQLPRMQLLALLTYRDAEVGEPLGRTISELHRRRLATRIRLDALSETATSDLLEGLAGQSPPPALASLVYAHTEGHPFFVEEVFRDLAGTGRLVDPEDRVDHYLATRDLGVPEGVRLVVGRRIERLSPTAQRLLADAAVAGRVFSFRLLRSLSDLPPETILDAVDEARRAVLVGDHDGDFVFSHELIRGTLVAGMSPARLRRAHRRAAEAMADVWADSLDEHAAEIVHHLTEAGDEVEPGTLLPFLLRAGRRALDTSAFDQAVEHLERAAAIDDHRESAERAELYHALGSARERLGRVDDALAAWSRSLAQFEALGDRDAVGRVCLAAGAAMAWAVRIPESLALYQRGLDALEQQATDTRARLLASRAGLLQFMDPPTADAMFDEALDLVAALDDDHLRGFVNGEVSFGMHGSMRPAQGHRASVVAARLLAAAGDLWGTASALSFAEFQLLQLGRFADSAEVGAELAPLAERVGNHMALFTSSRAEGTRRWFSTGGLDDLEAFGRADLEFATRMGWPTWTSHSYCWLALSRHLRGDWDGAEVLFAQANAAALAPSHGGSCWGAWLCFLATTGRDAEAAAFLESVRAELPRPGHANTWGAWTLLMAAVEASSSIGARDEAASWYPLVLEARATGTVTVSYVEGRLLERVAGIAAAAARRWEEAQDHFEAALAHGDALPHQFERLEVRRSYSAMLADRAAAGDIDRARALLGEATKGYRRLGMPRHAALAQDALSRLELT